MKKNRNVFRYLNLTSIVSYSCFCHLIQSSLKNSCRGFSCVRKMEMSQNRLKTVKQSDYVIVWNIHANPGLILSLGICKKGRETRSKLKKIVHSSSGRCLSIHVHMRLTLKWDVRRLLNASFCSYQKKNQPPLNHYYFLHN